MESSFIQVQELYKSYHRDSLEIPVLRNINLEISQGEFIAFMGPSGSGKTTLLNLIAGIDKPTSGKIFIDRIDVGELSETELAVWRSRNVGFIFQFYNLIPVLTALENALERNRISWSNVSAVVTIGGGASIPLITARLSEHAQAPVLTTPQPALDAAVGAALFAAYGAQADAKTGVAPAPVSYTHLTLPTIYSV